MPALLTSIELQSTVSQRNFSIICTLRNLFDDFGRYAAHQTIIRHIFCDHRSGCNNRIFANGHTCQNGCVSTDLRAVFNYNGVTLKVTAHSPLSIQRVCSCADDYAGSNKHILADFYPVGIQNRYVAVENRSAADVDVLAVITVKIAFDGHMASDRTEKLLKEHLPFQTAGRLGVDKQ